MIRIFEERDYIEWYESLNNKEKSQIESRLERIKTYGHFGDVKKLGEGLAELRWKNGWRIYFCSDGPKRIILIIGGNKNEQEKNLKKARIYIKRVTTH